MTDERYLQEVVDILSSIEGFSIRPNQPVNMFELRNWLKKQMKRYPDKDFIEAAERYETWAMKVGPHYGPGVFRRILKNPDLGPYEATKYAARFKDAPLSMEEQMRLKRVRREQELKEMGITD